MDEYAELNLSEIYRILWGRKTIFITLFIIVFFTVVTVSLLIPPTYRASSKIIVQNETNFYPAGIMPQTGEDRVFLNTQREIMSSSLILNKALNDIKDKRSSQTGVDYYPRPKGKLSIDYIDNSNILEAKVDGKDEEGAVEFANAITSAFINYHVDAKKGLVDQNLDIIAQKSNVLKKDIENIEARLKGFSDKEQLNFYYLQAPHVFGGLVQLKNDNIAADLDIERTQMEMNETNDALTDVNKRFIYRPLSTNAFGMTPQSFFGEHPWIDSLRSKLANKENQLEELLTDYTEDYSQVQALRHQIVLLNKTLDSALKKVLVSYKDYYKGNIDFLEFRKKKNELGEEERLSDLDTISKNINKAAVRQIEYSMLLKTYDIKQNMYALYLHKQKDLELLKENVSNANISNIRMLESASLPLQKVSPNLRLNFLLGALFGVFIGIGGCLVTEKKDSSKKKYKMPAGLPVTERRSMSRLGMGLLVTYELIGDAAHVKYNAVSKNISGTGIMIEADKHLSKDFQLLLKIYLNDKDYIIATGEVIWTNPSKEKNVVEGGLHFVKIDSQEREKLINYLYGEHYLTQNAQRG